jgi:hypothetical protein
VRPPPLDQWRVRNPPYSRVLRLGPHTPDLRNRLVWKENEICLQGIALLFNTIVIQLSIIAIQLSTIAIQLNTIAIQLNTIAIQLNTIAIQLSTITVRLKGITILLRRSAILLKRIVILCQAVAIPRKKKQKPGQVSHTCPRLRRRVRNPPYRFSF